MSSLVSVRAKAIVVVGLALLLTPPAPARGPRWGGLEAVAVSPDGKTLAVGGQNRVVYLLDAPTLEVKRRFWIGARVGALAFSPDGSRLLIEDDSDRLSLYDTAAWKEVAVVPRCAGLAVSASTGLVVVSDPLFFPGTRLRLLSPADGSVKAVFDLSERVSAYAFAPDGKRLLVLTASQPGAEEKVPIEKAPAGLTDLARQEFRLKHDGRVALLLELEVLTGKRLAARSLWYTSDSDSTVLVPAGARTWVLNFGNTCARIRGDGTSLFQTALLFNYAVATSADGKLLVCGGLREGYYGPLGEERRVKFAIDELPGRAEYFGAFALTAEGTAYGVTSAFRAVRIDREGKVTKVAPVF